MTPTHAAAIALMRPPNAADAATRSALAAVHASGVRTQVLKTASVQRPIIDVSKNKRTVFCVALEPHMVDDHGDVMTPDDIEYTAHRFMTHSRIVKSQHDPDKPPINAAPVESFIAPCDLHFGGGMYGAQTVKQGSWVIGLQVRDDAEWQKIVDGQYTGVSVGGFGMRQVFA